MKKVSCDICTNNTCLVKKNFTSEWVELLDRGKNMWILGSGTNIFEAGNPISGLYFVQNGLIKEYVTGVSNKVEIIRFVSPGCLFGHLGLDKENYLYSAAAQVESTVCFIDNTVLLELFKYDAGFMNDLMKYFSKIYSKNVYRLKCVSQMNLREKVAEALLYIVEDFGKGGSNELCECFNREDIASLASTTPEQVSRQLSDFERESIIEKRGRKIVVLSREKLKSILEGY